MKLVTPALGTVSLSAESNPSLFNLAKVRRGESRRQLVQGLMQRFVQGLVMTVGVGGSSV